MRKQTLTSLAVAAALFGTSAVVAEETDAPAAADATAERTEQPALNLESDDQKISYFIGGQIASDVGQLGELGIDLDVDLMVRGLRDTLTGESGMSEDQAMETMTLLQEKIMAYQMEQQEAMAQQQPGEPGQPGQPGQPQQQQPGQPQQQPQEQAAPSAAENLQQSEAFLAANAERDDVNVTDSGLQYRVIESGDGQSPGSDDRVRAHYTGRLIDGTTFDSSVQRGQPFEFSTSGGVIPGWIEAAQMMKEGDKWEIYLPPNLGYGERGAGDAIPPNSALVFEIELLEVLD